MRLKKVSAPRAELNMAELNMVSAHEQAVAVAGAVDPAFLSVTVEDHFDI